MLILSSSPSLGLCLGFPLYLSLLQPPSFSQASSCSLAVAPSPPSPRHTKGYGLSGSDWGAGCHPLPSGAIPRAEAGAGEAAVTGPQRRG